jgi:hypothetical protein
MAASATDKLRDKLQKLFALLGSANAKEREAARVKIDELLAKNKKNWNDLTELLFTGNAYGWQDDEPDGDDQPDHCPPTPAPLDLIEHILRRHLHLTEHQFIAVTLWIAHTLFFRAVLSDSAAGRHIAGQRMRQEYVAQHHQGPWLQHLEERPHHSRGSVQDDRP